MIDYPGETKYDKEFITFVLKCRTRVMVFGLVLKKH